VAPKPQSGDERSAKIVAHALLIGQDGEDPEPFFLIVADHDHGSSASKA
jgi:hypothetical protein